MSKGQAVIEWLRTVHFLKAMLLTMKQGSSHRRTVSENQELFNTKQRRLNYQSTTWAPVVGWRQVNSNNN